VRLIGAGHTVTGRGPGLSAGSALAMGHFVDSRGWYVVVPHDPRSASAEIHEQGHDASDGDDQHEL
jgi:hypothetical protein